MKCVINIGAMINGVYDVDLREDATGFTAQTRQMAKPVFTPICSVFASNGSDVKPDSEALTAAKLAVIRVVLKDVVH